jgi:hypothetical protein
MTGLQALLREAAPAGLLAEAVDEQQVEDE